MLATAGWRSREGSIGTTKKVCMNNIYHDLLLDHYRHSPHKRILEYSDFHSEEYNPSCGDRVSFAGCVRDGQLSDLAFQGHGCVISQATASLLTQEAQGKNLAQVCMLDKDAILRMIGIPVGLTRLKCALLPLQALHQGIAAYQMEKERKASCSTAQNLCKNSKTL
jgi:nitrogen fixation protein NifU and related proteins